MASEEGEYAEPIDFANNLLTYSLTHFGHLGFSK